MKFAYGLREEVIRLCLRHSFLIQRDKTNDNNIEEMILFRNCPQRKL